MTEMIGKYMEKLKNGSVQLSPSGLQSLSDLSREEIQVFRQTWPTIPTERRRQITRTLVELAEDNFELDYTAIYKTCVTDIDPQVRAAAVDGLWEDDDPNTAELLVRIMGSDPAPEVRARAAVSLGHFVYEMELEELDEIVGSKVRNALLATIENNNEELEVRRRAIEAVSYLSDEAITPLLVWAYNHPDMKMRVSAIFGMGRNCNEQWLPNIFRELESENPELRFEAVRACGEMESKRCVPKLIPMLQDTDVEVRLEAATALGKIGGKAAKRALLSILETSEDEQMQEAAEEALEEIDFFEHPMSFQP